MELALNLVWACVAVVGQVVLFFTLSRATDPSDLPPQPWRKFVAMSCVLVILFFVISMTDDLHDQEFLLEESKHWRIVPGSGSIQAPGSEHLVPVVFLLLYAHACVPPALPAVRRFVESSRVMLPAAIDCDRLHGRAPPASLA